MHLDPDRFATADALAEHLKVSPQVLNYWRVSGQLKDTVKRGRTRLYRVVEVLDVDAKMREARPAGRLRNGRKPTERKAA